MAKILHTSWKLVGIKMILYEKGRVFSVQTLFVEKEKPFLFDCQMYDNLRKKYFNRLFK